MAKPKLLVFDLDYTLWPFWVDTHVDPPFNKRSSTEDCSCCSHPLLTSSDSDGQVYDRHGRKVSFYPEVPQVLQSLHSQGYILAVASRTSCIPEAHELCKLFNWDHFFTYKEIYPGSKVTHFSRFHKASGIPYREMIFFDDEHRNIVEVGELGVTCVLADNGVTEALVQQGFEMFRRNCQSSR